MRKFAARWWTHPWLSQWKMMSAAGDYPFPFVFFPRLDVCVDLDVGNFIVIEQRR